MTIYTTNNISLAYHPYNQQNICGLNDIVLLNTLVERISFNNHPINLFDIINEAPAYEAIKNAIYKEYNYLHQVKNLSIRKILSSDANENDLFQVAQLNSYQAGYYLEGMPLDYAMKIEDYGIDVFKRHSIASAIEKSNDDDRIKAYGKAFKALDQQALEVIPDMNGYQARAYLDGMPLDHAMEVDSFEKRDAFKHNIPKDLLLKFREDSQVRAYGKAFEALDQKALELIPDMDEYQAYAYLEGTPFDYAMEIDRFEIREAFENHVPKDLLHKFHNEYQVKAYGKAFEALDQKALELIPDMTRCQATAYLYGAPLDDAMEVDSFEKRDAFKHNIPKELLHKFREDSQVRAYGKAFEALDQKALELIPDMIHWVQARAYFDGAPLDYAMEIDHFETRSAFKRHSIASAIEKSNDDDRIKAYGKAFKALDQQALEVIPDMNGYQARAYLDGMPLDHAMEVDSFEKRDAFKHNIPKDLLHKFHDDDQVKAYGKAFEASDQQALELIPDMNREQARAYLKTVSLDCAMELGGDAYNDADNSCLEKLEYITYENLGEFIGCMGKSFLQGVSYDQYSEYFSSWWNG